MRSSSWLSCLALAFVAAVGCGEGSDHAAAEVDASAEVSADARDAAPDAGGDADAGADVAELPDLGPDAAPDAAGDAPGEVLPPSYPLDDTLRVNHIQAMGTHNSYHVRPDEETIPPWDYTHAPLDVQLGELGVRQVELDIHYTGPGEFAVFHLPLLDSVSTCADLASCMGDIRRWSDAHRGHHLIWVLIEPKDEVDSQKLATHFAEVDDALRAAWPRERVLTPDDLRGTHASIRERLTAEGWPTLGATRDKVMFVMLDEGDNQKAYLDTFPGLEGAMIFMRGGRGEPWGCVLELNDAPQDAAAIATALAEGYLVRSGTGGADSTPEELATRAAAALAAGANFISTDFPAGTPDAPWTFTIPGGQPSRCNPVTAPAECKPADIEALPSP
ncbi:MAG: Ca2+-dependent phosphoinositide-specific phospholipase C [Myxococcota bacterium]